MPVLALSGCGNYLNIENVGITGLSTNEHGDVTVHMYACEDNAVTGLQLSGGFYDGPEGSNNPPLGRLEPPEPQSGYSAVNLSSPAPWNEVEPVLPATGRDRILIAGPEPEGTGSRLPFTPEVYLPQVALSQTEIDALEPGVIVRDSTSEGIEVFGTTEDFIREGEDSCARR